MKEVGQETMGLTVRKWRGEAKGSNSGGENGEEETRGLTVGDSEEDEGGEGGE